MATITARITISSSDLTGDSLSISKSFNLTSNSGTGISETSGLNRLNGLNTITTIFSAADYVNEEAYLFIHNTDTGKSNKVILTQGSQQIAFIQGGDSIFMAIDPAILDIKLTADLASTTVEYQLFHNG